MKKNRQVPCAEEFQIILGISLSRIWSKVMSDSCDPWTVAHPTPLSMGILQARTLESFAVSFSRDLPDLRIEPESPALQAHSLPTELQGKSKIWSIAPKSLTYSCIQWRRRTYTTSARWWSQQPQWVSWKMYSTGCDEHNTPLWFSSLKYIAPV